jgi:hypothetical protein
LRGTTMRQLSLLSMVTPDELVPAEHPIRRVLPMVDRALERLGLGLFGLLHIVPFRTLMLGPFLALCQGRPPISRRRLLQPSLGTSFHFFHDAQARSR